MLQYKYKKERQGYQMKLVNDLVNIDFAIPDRIQKILNNIDKYAAEFKNSEEMDIETWLQYDVLLQELDIVSKKYLNSGVLKSDQRNRLLKKYNAW